MRPILVARAESGKYFRSFFGRITDKLFDYETLFLTDRDIDITDKRTDVWSRPSCIYTQIFSPKKTVFPP